MDMCFWICVFWLALLSQSGIDANGVRRENVARHASVLFAHFNAAPKPAVFANVTVPRLSGALNAAGCVVGLRRLLFGVRKRRFQ